MEREKDDDNLEITAWISSKQKRKMQTHDNFSESGIIADALLEAWDDLADKHREQINWANENLSWNTGDHHLEFRKHQVGQTTRYVRSDMYCLGLKDHEKLKEEGRYKDFKTAIKMWNGKQLTAQLQMTDAYEMEADSS